MVRIRARVLLLLSISCGALITSGTASAACVARPLVLLHPSSGSSRTVVKLPAFLRATLICGEERGLRGLKGEAGRTGATGPAGANGAPGATGSPGPAGAPGANGTNGIQGLPGTPGSNGTNGVDGGVGPPGPLGTSSYAYVYDTGGQTVAVNASVLFDTNGLRTSSITHVAGTSDVVLATAGIYKVTVSVLADDPFEIALFQNGAPTAGGTFAGDGSTRQAIGDTIIAVSPGDVLTVRNHGSAGPIALDAGGAGTALNVDASILIERLA